MGIYIKGMEMPKNGETITITICDDGSAFEERKEPGRVFKAIHVPPHGRLGDLDALWVEINTICDRRAAEIISDLTCLQRLLSALTCLQQLLSAIRHIPTIIPADPAEEGKS